MKMVFRGIVCLFKLFALVKVYYYLLLFLLALPYLEYLEINKCSLHTERKIKLKLKHKMHP